MRLVFNPFTGTLDYVEAAPPLVTNFIETEAGDPLVTEAGDKLILES